MFLYKIYTEYIQVYYIFLVFKRPFHRKFWETNPWSTPKHPTLGQKVSLSRSTAPLAVGLGDDLSAIDVFVGMGIPTWRITPGLVSG